MRIMDRGAAVTCSKIAAGLITPVTGMRLSVSNGFLQELSAAVPFYRALERKLGCRFLFQRRHVRLFKDTREVDLWSRRSADPQVQRFLTQRAGNQPLLDHTIFTSPRGGFEMKHGGYLDTAAYLKASRQAFLAMGILQEAEVEPAALESTSTHIRCAGEVYSTVIFCNGWEAAQHPWFSWLPFKSARGAIATVAADLGGEKRILHHGCWLQPRVDNIIRAGSTYDLSFTDPHAVTQKDVDTLNQKLSDALHRPAPIQDIVAAVRPILPGQRVIVGRHPARQNAAVFNGLGSKGALRAPFYAEMLASHLMEGKPIPPSNDLFNNDL